MDVRVPYTRLDPRTAALLDRHLPRWAPVPLGDSPTAYCEWLRRKWSRGRTVLIVEHDIGVHDQVMPSLSGCAGWWCAFPYPIGEQQIPALGCTRLAGELMAAEPDLMDVVASVAPAGDLPAGDWRRLDIRLLDELYRRGYTRCVHGPPVEHFHVYPPAPSLPTGVPRARSY